MKQLESKLIEINQRHQTNFSLSGSPGFSAAGDFTYFDADNRKILFLKLDGRVWWLFDFEMIGAWRIYLDERFANIRIEAAQAVAQEVYLEFILKDPKLAPISMAVKDQRTANLWDHRMILMLA